MNTALTIERLYDMRLGAMAEAFSTELERSGDPALGFTERFGLVIEHQWVVREEGRLARRLKNAALKIDASIEEIDFTAARGLDRAVIADLAELSFLKVRRQHHRHRRHGAGQDLPGLRDRGSGLPPRTQCALQASGPPDLRALTGQSRRQLSQGHRQARASRSADPR
jgi:hypothetical protein